MAENQSLEANAVVEVERTISWNFIVQDQASGVPVEFKIYWLLIHRVVGLGICFRP